jgi:hypothetical protein
MYGAPHETHLSISARVVPKSFAKPARFTRRIDFSVLVMPESSLVSQKKKKIEKRHPHHEKGGARALA